MSPSSPKFYLISILLSFLFFLVGFLASKFPEYNKSIIPMILLALPSYYFFLKNNFKKSLLVILILSIYATLIEAISITTGFPYGFFEYGDNLGFKLFNIVPWAVSFGWVPLVIGSMSISSYLFKSKLKRIIFSTIILLLADLVLDPGAVSLAFWKWSNIGLYYTVPLTNFIGWIFSGIIGSVIFILIYKTKPKVMTTITLILGNAFWIGVNLESLFLIPFIIGLVFHMGLLYFLFTSSGTNK